MSGLSLARLIAAGSRGDRVRLAGIACGVAIGVMLALLLGTGFTALEQRSLRSTWTDLGRQAGHQDGFNVGTVLADDELAAVREDEWVGEQVITVLRVTANPTSTVFLPGIGSAPPEGSVWVSPELARLIANRPADELGDRFGKVAGMIADEALAGPDALVAVVGVPAERLRNLAQYYQGLAGNPYANENYRVVAIIGGLALAVPVILLLAVVTALGSAQRAERLATLRLIGATPNRLAQLAAIETAATSVVGAAAGVALAWLVAPLVALVPIGGERFFPGDLRGGWPATLGVAAAVIAVAVGVAAARARFAESAPPGSVRDRRERPPRWWAVAPLLAGIVLLLAGFAQESTSRAAYLLVAGFGLVTVGLLSGGPLVTALVARFGARTARSAAGVIALNRIRRHPRRVFRAASGVVVAVFLVSVFSGAISAVTSGYAAAEEGPDRLPSDTLVVDLTGEPSGESLSEREMPRADDPTLLARIDRLRAVDGVRAVALVSWDSTQALMSGADATALGFPSDAELVAMYDLGAPFVPVAVEPVADLYAQRLLVLTDGPPALERARTAVRTIGFWLASPPWTRADLAGATALTWAGEFATLANLGIGVAAVISALAMAVATLSGILDRRRAFGLLRLTGMPWAALRRTILIEAGVPVLTVFAGAAGLGYAVAAIIVTALTDGRRQATWPAPDYLLMLALALLAAALAVTATLGAARRTTDGTATRFE